MLTRDSLRASMDGTKRDRFTPQLIPRAYAFVPMDEHPEAFRAFAHDRMPIPALEPITGTMRAMPSRGDSQILFCKETGPQHFEALEAAVQGTPSLAILTVSDEPVATLKRIGYGMQNVLSFRYQSFASEDGPVHPLIPGGVYLPPKDIIMEAYRAEGIARIPIDRKELYPATMLFDSEDPRTARELFAKAQSLFSILIGE
jgi:hypothetical protein